ncbi:MAG: protein kinase [Acidobacteria bacterium]|nr:protein kinase [Acidobacteriota bacterium]
MNPDDWQKVKAIFDAAVQIEPDGRRAFLENACAGDKDLLREVEVLLSSSDAAGSFMETPFAGEIEGLSTDTRLDQLEPGQTFNHYKIIRKIGAGGMGEVYLSQDTRLKRFVAIKILYADATRDPETLGRFIQEARAASALNHPNILTVYEFGQTDDMHFISTEFVDGETLRARLSRSSIDPRTAINIAVETASALVAAHEANIVHRDIKPDNIMVREDGYVKILDFGLAKLSVNQGPAINPEEGTWHDVKTTPGMIVGTVSYMSPEQARGIEVDERTDIWSLGVVLYEMITRQKPFQGPTPSDVIASVLKVEPQQIENSGAGFHRRLQQILKKALSKSRGDRYQTMRDMVGDLKGLGREIETGAAAPRSIAILPFTNITRDASVGFFEFALADAVITELARSRSLVVRPSAAVARYLGQTVDPLVAGKELKVDAILTANFLLASKRIRVTTQLIDVLDKNVIWGESIDSDADDIIGLQDTITHRIVDGLKCELATPSHTENTGPTIDSLAYMEYLRGRDQLRSYVFHTVANGNVEIAIEHFKRAIDFDPGFALPYSGLGMCYLQRVIKVVGGREDIERAAEALDHALSLDPQIIEARAYRAFTYRLQGETQKSREQMSELRHDAPHTFEVQYLSAAGFRFDGDYQNAFRCHDEMLRIDPTARATVHCFRARLFWYQGKFEEAFQEIELGRKLEPNHPYVRIFHAILTFRSGDPGGSAKLFRTLFKEYPSDGLRPYMSMCLSAVGEKEAALNELTESTERVAAADPNVAYWLASAYLMAGKTDLALKWLEGAIALGNHNLPWFESNPVWKPLFGDQSFNELMSRLRSSRFLEMH